MLIPMTNVLTLTPDDPWSHVVVASLPGHDPELTPDPKDPELTDSEQDPEVPTPPTPHPGPPDPGDPIGTPPSPGDPPPQPPLPGGPDPVDPDLRQEPPSM